MVLACLLALVGLAGERLVIWDDDGCDMLYYPYHQQQLAKEPISVRNFELVFLEAVEGTKADVIGYSGVVGFGYFTALNTGASVNTNQFAAPGRNMRNGVNEFRAIGHDALEMAVAHAHRNGKECFWSLRFNDNHDNDESVEKPGIALSPFKVDNPEIMVGRGKCCGKNAADFAQAKVREFVKKYVRTTLENYDLDGIEFDFFRHPQLFRTVAMGGHATEAELGLMTALMGELREIADGVGRRRGRPVTLCARVPDSVGYCKAIGIDLEAWAREKALDFLIVGGYFQLEPWRKSAEMVHGWGMKCYASIDESRIGRVDGVKCLPGRDSAACWLGRTAAAMASGMDGVNYFNLEYYKHELQKQVMEHDIRRLDGVEKLYFATYVGGGGYLPRDFLVDGEDYWKTTGVNPARPVKMKAGGRHAFELVVGDDFGEWRRLGKEPKITLKLLAEAEVAVKIVVNGVEVALGEPKDGVYVAEVAPEVVRKGVNEVEVTAGSEVTLHDFSLAVALSGCQSTAETGVCVQDI